MKNLPKAVREKAIEIANALLNENKMSEGIIISTAISRAKDWAANRGMKIKLKGKESASTDVKKHGEDRYVIPYKEDLWAIKNEGSARVEKSFREKKTAIQVAKKKAKKANASVIIQLRTGRVEKKISYNPNRRKKK